MRSRTPSAVVLVVDDDLFTLSIVLVLVLFVLVRQARFGIFLLGAGLQLSIAFFGITTTTSATSISPRTTAAACQRGATRRCGGRRERRGIDE
jgi:hypothetical protein